MELINNTPYVAHVSQTVEHDGQRFISVLVKATYEIPKDNDARARPSDSQTPILLSDIFDGEPGLSAPLVESDLAPKKTRCDVLINAHAYTPNAKPKNDLIVAFKLAEIEKRLTVTGDRTWQKRLVGLMSSKIKPFTTMPIHYGRAFGGQWLDTQNSQKSIAYAANPVGCGYAKGKFIKQLDGTPLPNVHEYNRVVSDYSKSYKPQSFGPIGRSWQPRVGYAGTYDEHWKENIFPLPPADLNDLYYQAAPKDQQIAPPVGGETVSLLNLHPDRELVRFPLPRLALPIHILTGEQQHKLTPTVDTIQITPHENVFNISWRARVPINRTLREVEAVVVGNGFKLWYQSHLQNGGCCGDD